MQYWQLALGNIHPKSIAYSVYMNLKAYGAVVIGMGFGAIIIGIALTMRVDFVRGQPAIPPPPLPAQQRWSDWSCLNPAACASYTFRQDHYVSGLAYSPLTMRVGQAVSYSASATLYNDDSAGPAARALYNVPLPSGTWTFKYCDTGTSISGCNLTDLTTVSTGTSPTIPPPNKYGAWPVYCTSTDTATCPTGANRPTANQGFYQTGGVTHIFPSDGVVAASVSVLDSDGHSCTYEKTFGLKARIPSWYEVAPRF